jgi:hypothetical protein
MHDIPVIPIGQPALAGPAVSAPWPSLRGPARSYIGLRPKLFRRLAAIEPRLLDAERALVDKLLAGTLFFFAYYAAWDFIPMRSPLRSLRHRQALGERWTGFSRWLDANRPRHGDRRQ